MAASSNATAFTLTRPAAPACGLVLTSPHSGRNYSPEFLQSTRLDTLAIRRSEDSFVDELVAAGPALGIPLLAAQFPRAYCDVNREAWELDPSMFEDPLPIYVNTASPRVQAGLGTLARVVGNGEPIYGTKLKFAEAQHRIHSCYEPFHDALAGLINETRARFGYCVVIDCHSMPSAPVRPAQKADIVLGDGHGTSCAPVCAQGLETALTAAGFSVRRNDPYAGGHITRFYGRPREGVHVLQLELARALYMNERDFSRAEGFALVQARLTRVLGQLVAGLPGWGFLAEPLRAAAE